MKKIRERKSFPFLYRTHAAISALKGKRDQRKYKRQSDVREKQKSVRKASLIPKIKKHLSNVVYDEEFIYFLSRSNYRAQIISNMKKIRASSTCANKFMDDKSYSPQLDGPPREAVCAFDLFSIVNWNNAVKQLPRKMNSEKVSLYLKIHKLNLREHLFHLFDV